MKDAPLYEKIPPWRNNYPIKLMKCNSRNGLHAHWHEHLELHFYMSSGYKVMCDNQLIEVEEDDLVVINRDQVHFSDMGVEGIYYCIIISPDFFKDLEIKNVEFVNVIKGDQVVKKYIEDIFLEFFGENEGWDMAVKGVICNLLVYLLRNYKKKDQSGGNLKIRKSSKKRISEILDFISTCYYEKLTTRDLSERFFMSEYYFCRYFKKTMGQSPVEYINRYRIEKATVLLEDGEKNVAEIAAEVGFDDQNYFARVFKKVMGITPQEYRKQL